MDEKEQEEINHDEHDRLFYELVVRQSALERALIKKNVLSEAELAEAQVECMAKIQAVIDAKQKEADVLSVGSATGFIKYGEKHEDYDWSHESREKNK